jgi:hypothetical protein
MPLEVVPKVVPFSSRSGTNSSEMSEKRQPDEEQKKEALEDAREASFQRRSCSSFLARLLRPKNGKARLESAALDFLSQKTCTVKGSTSNTCRHPTNSNFRKIQ